MLTMMRTDFITMKNSALQLAFICLFIAVFISIGSGTLIAGIAAVAAMLPFMYIFSITAYDELNGWERFRLTLPISRRQVALGRYASTLVVIVMTDVLMLCFALAMYAIALLFPQVDFFATLLEQWSLPILMGHALLISTVLLLASALALPLFLRFGMTKATRIAPMLIVLLAVLGLWVVGNFNDSVTQMLPMLEILIAPGMEQAMTSFLLSLLIFVVMLVPYAISAGIAMRVYEKRQF